MAKFIPSEDWQLDEVCDMVIMEDYDLTLEDEFNKRRASGKRFTEDELWKLADACICALAKM